MSTLQGVFKMGTRSRPRLKNSKVPPSPKLKMRGDSSKSHSVSSEEQRMKVTGVSPLTMLPDNDERYQWFEKVRRFYVKFTDGKQIKDGLGEHVDWLLKYGEDKFNERLRKRYNGCDLTTLAKSEEDESRLKDNIEDNMSVTIRKNFSLTNERSRSQTLSRVQVNTQGPRTRGGSSTAMMALNNIFSKKSYNKDIESKEGAGAKDSRHEETLRTHLIEFFMKQDPHMIDSDKFDGVVDYGCKKGLSKLNTKLLKRYGKQLDLARYDSDMDSVAEGGNTTLTRKKKSFNEMFNNAHQKKKNRQKKDKDSSMNLKQLIAEDSVSVTSKAYVTTFDPVPSYYKEFLTLYYACYDVTYIEKNKVDSVYREAVNNGLDYIDKQFSKKYKESLREFKCRVEGLQDELQTFYAKIDPPRASDGVFHVLQWSLRNGRKYVNKSLSKRYGYHLDNYDEIAGIEDPVLEDPVF